MSSSPGLPSTLPSWSTISSVHASVQEQQPRPGFVLKQQRLHSQPLRSSVTSTFDSSYAGLRCTRRLWWGLQQQRSQNSDSSWPVMTTGPSLSPIFTSKRFFCS